MSNSPLVNYTKISPNRTAGRTAKVDTITIHCVVGQCSVEALGSLFANASYRASSNYGIGADGRVGCYVNECDRSWCSSSSYNDNRAVTIECASDTTEPLAVRDVVYEKCIQLVADICKRNGIKKLIWSTNKNERVNHLNGCNMTVHRDYANKSCPGSFLYNRMGDIAAKANAILGNPDYRPTLKKGDSGSYVKELQTDLIKLGYNLNPYGADGDFGNTTESAVRLYQAEHDLTVDGICGDATWKSILAEVEAHNIKVVDVAAGTPLFKDPPYSTVAKGKYTIVEEKNGCGRLKSGVGWIPLR